MRLNRGDWIAFAWAWLGGMTGLGGGLLIAPFFLAEESNWVDPGSGTALLLVAASILFVIVLDPFTQVRRDWLLRLAGILTAFFGYAGTLKVLDAENSLLMTVVWLTTFYVAWLGGIFVLLIRLVKTLVRFS